MARFRLTVVFIVCVRLVSGAAVAQEQGIAEGGTVHGYITDTTPAQLPIVGVRVQIENGKGQIFETTSAETGEFIYRDIPTDDYLINIHKSGYQRRIGKPVSVANGGVHYVTLTMNEQEDIFTRLQNWFSPKEPQGGTLQLRVTTPSPQPAPIENAEVKIWQIRGSKGSSSNKIEITGISDASGQYRHDNLPLGIYFVTVGKDDYHTTISMTVRENRMTTAAVELPISNGTADINVLPPHETDTKWVIRGKIFETNFQQTPVSGVEVRIRGVDLEQPMEALSNGDGEYEFTLPPGHYVIFLDKEGYMKTMSFPEISAEGRQSSVTVIEEGMFVVYDAVAKRNELVLKHRIPKEQRSFSEEYGDTIQLILISMMLGSMLSFIVNRLNKRQQKYNQE